MLVLAWLVIVCSLAIIVIGINKFQPIRPGWQLCQHGFHGNSEYGQRCTPHVTTFRPYTHTETSEFSKPDTSRVIRVEERTVVCHTKHKCHEKGEERRLPDSYER